MTDVTRRPTFDLESASADLKAVRGKNIVAFEGRTDIYALGLQIGRVLWRRPCPAGRTFNGLGGAHPGGVGMYCDQEELIVDG